MKVTYSFIAVLLITLFTGCKQDFDITADYIEVPVVYGLLNQQDDTSYIRIQKGYLIDGNALIAAGVPDSVYYPDVLTVKFVPYNANGSSGGVSITLNRVDGNTVSLPKETGTFANTPNWLYSFNTPLDPTKNYKLEVTNTSNGYTFSNKKIDGINGVTLVKDFQVLVPTKAAKINLQNTSSTKVVWNAAENAGVYDLTVRFHYREYLQLDNSLLKDTFVDILLFKSLAYDYNGGGSVTPFEITSDNILGFLANHLTASPDVYREFSVQKGMQFKFAAGGTELAKFMNSKNSQGGLASNEALPPYTNIDGGVGLLSSRYFKQVDSVLLSNNGLDSLACSAISRGLRFKNHSGNICQ